MITINYKTIISVAVLLLVIGIVSMLMQQPWRAGASVSVGNQYQSTTTPQVADRTNLCPKRGSNLNNVGSSTTGVLGSVNVTLVGVSGLAIYDATTTNANLREIQATSSLLLADFPSSATAGSYHFDVEFNRGLLVDYGGAGISTTTISYRCES